MVLNLVRMSATLILLLTASAVFSQSIEGTVLDKRDNKPLSNVSISISKKKSGFLSDQKGHFKMAATKLKKSDTLYLSSIGYMTLKVPVLEALKLQSFVLTEEQKTLENVVVNTYTNHNSEGSFSEVAGFFASWSTKKNGGEIGRVIHVKSDNFKVEKIRFKINNQCDTCILRLHIRDLKNGLPYMDLIRDSLTIVVNRSSFDDKTAEFDLSKKNIIIKNNNYVFVGLETIRCNSASGGSCSLAYIGTEEGNYLFRTKEINEWEESNMSSLYLKMLYSY
ncbi:MAG: carboxypeptidase-like regulatory domain-containing protein [Chitinophagaceae bacterium]|nr:MAG: carboxypeptidase-like regulatory domain-containing protein [Chitinophagaceae bacterium]